MYEPVAATRGYPRTQNRVERVENESRLIKECAQQMNEDVFWMPKDYFVIVVAF